MLPTELNVLTPSKNLRRDRSLICVSQPLADRAGMEPEDVRGPDPEGTEEGEAPRCSCLSSRSLRLEQLITHEMFSSIMSDFHRHGQSSPERQGVQEWTKMTTEDFQVAIAKQLGRSPQDKSIVRLCNKVRC